MPLEEAVQTVWRLLWKAQCGILGSARRPGAAAPPDLPSEGLRARDQRAQASGLLSRVYEPLYAGNLLAAFDGLLWFAGAGNVRRAPPPASSCVHTRYHEAWSLLHACCTCAGCGREFDEAQLALFREGAAWGGGGGIVEAAATRYRGCYFWPMNLVHAALMRPDGDKLLGLRDASHGGAPGGPAGGDGFPVPGATELDPLGLMGQALSGENAYAVFTLQLWLSALVRPREKPAGAHPPAEREGIAAALPQPAWREKLLRRVSALAEAFGEPTPSLCGYSGLLELRRGGSRAPRGTAFWSMSTSAKIARARGVFGGHEPGPRGLGAKAGAGGAAEAGGAAGAGAGPGGLAGTAGPSGPPDQPPRPGQEPPEAPPAANHAEPGKSASGEAQGGPHASRAAGPKPPPSRPQKPQKPAAPPRGKQAASQKAPRAGSAAPAAPAGPAGAERPGSPAGAPGSGKPQKGERGRRKGPSKDASKGASKGAPRGSSKAPPEDPTETPSEDPLEDSPTDSLTDSLADLLASAPAEPPVSQEDVFAPGLFVPMGPEDDPRALLAVLRDWARGAEKPGLQVIPLRWQDGSPVLGVPFSTPRQVRDISAAQRAGGPGMPGPDRFLFETTFGKPALALSGTTRLFRSLALDGPPECPPVQAGRLKI